MNKKLIRYETIYKRLKRCFDISFGVEKRRGKIPMDEVKRSVMKRRRADWRNELPENTLIEMPNNFLEVLSDTYTGRNEEIVSGPIGCAETPAEQLDGITNMALLMYLSNQLKNKYVEMMEGNITEEQKELYEEKKNSLLGWKDSATSSIMASIYVLSKTDEEYGNYFSYGNRTDDDGKPTFVVDLPYIGQLCVHYGHINKKNEIVNNATDFVKSILQKKVELGQITQEQLIEITNELNENGVLPEYEGKLYEYVGAMPIEYVGEKIKRCMKIIGNKLPEDITSEDIKLMKNNGLNQRELYYLFIKIGASKDLLNEISGISKKITPQAIENDCDDITIDEFTGATQVVKDLALGKGQEKKDPNIRR